MVGNLGCGRLLLNCLEGIEKAHLAVALGCGGKVKRRMGQMVASFGHSYGVESRSIGLDHDNCVGVGKAHVLACAYHHASEDEARIFSGIDHLGKPVKRRIGVGASERFYEGAYHIEVVVSLLVVQNRLSLDAFFCRLLCDVYLVSVGNCGHNCKLQGVEKGPCVTVRDIDKVFQGTFFKAHIQFFVAALLVIYSLPGDFGKVV